MVANITDIRTIDNALLSLPEPDHPEEFRLGEKVKRTPNGSLFRIGIAMRIE